MDKWDEMDRLDKMDKWKEWINTVIQNAKSHSEIRFDVVWLLYNIFA